MHDIFYFTDVHGCYDLYRAAMNYCFEQDPECTVIFGGDACDRESSGYKIMKELLVHPQVIYLKGNHEDMFIQAAIAVLNNYHGELTLDSINKYLRIENMRDNGIIELQLYLANGGFYTIMDWMLDGMPTDIIKQLIELPVTFSFENMDFCHAGGNYKTFARVVEAEYNDQIPEGKDEYFLLWDRNYLGQGWAPDRTCIFGHTPSPYIAAKYYGKDKSLANAHPCAYNATLDDKWTGRKIDMDTGAFVSGRLYVLNCLTMRAQGFYDKNIENDLISLHEIEKIEVIQF